MSQEASETLATAVIVGGIGALPWPHLDRLFHNLGFFQPPAQGEATQATAGHSAHAYHLVRGYSLPAAHGLLQRCESPVLIQPLASDGTPMALDALGQWVHDRQDTHVLYLYHRPEWHLAQAMAQGAPPSQALKAWKKAAQAMLNAQQQQCSRISLVEISAALAQPSHLAQALSTRLGWTVHLHDDSPLDASTDAVSADALQAALPLASHAVHQAEDMQALLEEVEACTINPTPLASGPSLDVDAIYAQQQDAQAQQQAQIEQSQSTISHLESTLSQRDQDLSAARTKLEETTEENDLLIKQLHHTQESLEEQLTTNQQLSKELAEHKAAQEKTTKQLKDTQGKLKKAEQNSKDQAKKLQDLEKRSKDQAQKAKQAQAEVQEENDLIIKQLHFTQEELEKYLIQSKDLIKQRDGLQKRLEKLSNEKKELQKRIELIRTSTSWRLTGPIRVTKRLLTGGGSNVKRIEHKKDDSA